MAYSESMDKIIIEDTRTGRKMTRYIWSEDDGIQFVKDGTLTIRKLKPYERIIERICAYGHNMEFDYEISDIAEDGGTEYIQGWYCTKCDYQREWRRELSYYDQES